ncbi:MAG: phospho-N-acetylmuramoyl-pentapeptide-transferase, partial [Acutalibacteraceae bacterium]
KTVLQLLVAAAYLLTMYLGGMHFTWIPFVGYVDITSGAGLLFWPIALMFIYGFTNAVNLTDGVDGLATGVTFVVVLFYELATASLMVYGYNLVSAALLGSLIGYLIWNLHPCKVMMGDTGSMFLGGIVVALAFSTEQPILLILSGILYLIEAMSDVIQIAHYKRTKKRIFKMAPIHHHFEMCGWSENKIVVVFSLISFVGCAAALLLMIFA